jgi:hypothetical protein
VKEAGPACVLEDLRFADIITYLLEADLSTPNISSDAKCNGAPRNTAVMRLSEERGSARCAEQHIADTRDGVVALIATPREQ